MTTTSHPAANHAAWIFPGRINLALVVNWRQAPMEMMLHDLKVARELESTRDSTLISRLRQLSEECSMALAMCRTRHESSRPCP